MGCDTLVNLIGNVSKELVGEIQCFKYLIINFK